MEERIITKEGIFHYTYAVLHNPRYREKYALNLKREFPRVPFYPDFHIWRNWGKALIELHVDYEAVDPYPLRRVETGAVPKTRLKADPQNGVIDIDGATRLTGVPPSAWAYKLGNRPALEWVLDQYKEKKPTDPTIAEKFNTYRFADYKEHVIDLLQRVCTVSVETMKILAEMEREPLSYEEIEIGLIRLSFNQEQAFRLIHLKLQHEIKTRGEDLNCMTTLGKWKKRYNDEIAAYLDKCEKAALSTELA